MKNNQNFSSEHAKYLKKVKKDSIIVWSFRFAILIFTLGIWELFATIGIVDKFITSCPSKIFVTISTLITENNLFMHMGVTLYETFVGFLIATIFGSLIALALWWSDKAQRILEPYIVVLNSLPKIALGPIIIVWFGSGTKSIIVMAV